MPKSNPSNPNDVSDDEIKRHVPLPVQKAKVLDSDPDSISGVHTARIFIYEDKAPHTAMVLPQAVGDVNVPKEGDDVAVIYGDNDSPWIIGGWYAFDRVAKGDVELPDYEPGDRIIGNEKGHIKIDNDGNIYINSSDEGSVYIDGVEQ